MEAGKGRNHHATPAPALAEQETYSETLGIEPWSHGSNKTSIHLCSHYPLLVQELCDSLLASPGLLLSDDYPASTSWYFP